MFKTLAAAMAAAAAMIIVSLCLGGEPPVPVSGKSITTTSTSTSTSAPARFRVASYNINFGMSGAKDVAAFVKIIRDCGADLVAIQETCPEVRKAIAVDLKKEYPFQKMYPGPAACSLVLLSKTKLSKHQLLPKTQGAYFPTAIAEVEIDGRTVQVMDIHLFPTLPKSDGLVAVMAAYDAAEAVRIREITSILKKVAAKKPVLLLGDFNMIADLTVYSMVTDKGFIDSAAEVSDPKDVLPTWHRMKDGEEQKLRLDYIFHSADFRTVTSKVVTEGNSDHYMVISEVQLLDKPATRPASKPASNRSHS